MGKFKIGIKFDKKFLNSLAQTSNSGVVMQNAKHHLALHPIHLNNFNKSVEDLLNEGIAKYNQSLDGILLGYGNIKLLSNTGVICNDSPYIHYDLLVDFFVFKPEIDKEMQGTVNRRSKDHVGLLVYNAFNVSIPKPKNEEDWLGNSVNIGYEVQFKITFIDLSSFLPYIRGELLSIVSEVDNVINDNIISTTRSTPNSKRIVFDSEEEDEQPKGEEDVEQPKRKKIKLEPETDDEANHYTKHKKSKKKKEKRREKEEALLAELKLDLFSDSKTTSNDSDNKYTEKKKSKKKSIICD